MIQTELVSLRCAATGLRALDPFSLQDASAPDYASAVFADVANGPCLPARRMSRPARPSLHSVAIATSMAYESESEFERTDALRATFLFVPPPCLPMIATQVFSTTKLEALNGRGRRGARVSHNLADIVAVVDESFLSLMKCAARQRIFVTGSQSKFRDDSMHRSFSMLDRAMYGAARTVRPTFPLSSNSLNGLCSCDCPHMNSSDSPHARLPHSSTCGLLAFLIMWLKCSRNRRTRAGHSA